MILPIIGLALALLGGIAGCVGSKLGTVLAVIPMLLWFGLLMELHTQTGLESHRGAELATALVVGLVAFPGGVTIARLVSVWAGTQRSGSGEERAKWLGRR